MVTGGLVCKHEEYINICIYSRIVSDTTLYSDVSLPLAALSHGAYKNLHEYFRYSSVSPLSRGLHIMEFDKYY